MNPFSRGKRILELSLFKDKTGAEAKRWKPNQSPQRTPVQQADDDQSILNISTSQLIDMPQDINLSFSADDLLGDLLPVSSALKTANFIMQHCPDVVAGSSKASLSKEQNDNVGLVEHVEGFGIADFRNEGVESTRDRNENGESTAVRNQRVEDTAVRNERVEDTEVRKEGSEGNSDVRNEGDESSGARNEKGVANGNVSDRRTKQNKKIDRKERRMHGKPYTGRHLDKEKKKFVEIEKKKKVLEQRCSCKASYYSCKEVSDVDRQRIHSDVWQMSWDEKKVFVRMSVDMKDVKERKGSSEKIKRNNTLLFHLRSNGEPKRVCKEMFLSTTGLKKWWVLNTLTTGDVQPHEKMDRVRPSSDGLTFVKEFIRRLPTMPSHYCRKDTSKVYLEPAFQSYADIYREYAKVCAAEEKQKMSRTIFVEELKAHNISIFQPRKDQCDLCCEFAQGHVDEGVYTSHRERKEAAQREKATDKELHPQGCRTKVVCVDVQRVLLAPSLKASALYYKTKLQVHNYTIYEMASKDVECFLWNEAEGGLNASEFASCLLSYLEEHAGSFDKIIIYSDGCTYQNRNRVLATALRHFCVKHQKVVEQKFLERGHTQMEVDSVHATIERRLKNVDIYSPLDYVNLIKASRINPRPYNVQYLSYYFFKDFVKYPQSLKSIKPSKEAKITDVCALRYNMDGSLLYKLNFVDDWQSLPLGRKDTLPTADPGQLHSSRRKIKKSKFDHLQALKTVLPSDVHSFYDALPHQLL